MDELRRLIDAEAAKVAAKKKLLEAFHDLAGTWEDNPTLPEIHLGANGVNFGAGNNVYLAPGIGFEERGVGKNREVPPEEFSAPVMIKILDKIVEGIKNFATRAELETENYLEAEKRCRDISHAAALAVADRE